MERNEAEEKMLGFYDYTVVLTYCSVISAVIGIYVSLSGAGHPYIGVMLLLLCGLFDTFDGRVARSPSALPGIAPQRNGCRCAAAGAGTRLCGLPGYDGAFPQIGAAVRCRPWRGPEQRRN